MRPVHQLPVYLIAIGAFALGMASYVTAGLVPLVTSAFAISNASAAQLVTAFTLAYALLSPLGVALLPGHRQRSGLLAALSLFVMANIGSALAPSFSVLLICRAAAGAGAGVYLALGIAAAVALSPASQRGKSIAILMGGMASGTVLGVPASLLIAERWGWEMAMWLIASLGAVALGGLAVLLPALPNVPPTPLLVKLRLFKHRPTLVILGISLIAAIASLGMYTFLAPFMASPTFSGMPPIALFLWVWGIGGIIGSFLIGPAVDKYTGPGVVLSIMGLLALSLLCLAPLTSLSPWLALLPIALWGAGGWALQVPQNNQLMRVRAKHGDGNLAVALNESALYLGSALGAVAGGILISSDVPLAALSVAAGSVAMLGAFIQLWAVKGSKTSSSHL